MLTSALDYHLPPELIAQRPAEPRDQSRLMHLHSTSGAISHHIFAELPHLLQPDDLLVFNDTRVLRARLHGRKAAGGGRVEALLLREVATNVWDVLLKPSARLRPGGTVIFESTDARLQVEAQLVERSATGWGLRFELPNEVTAALDVRELLPALGEVPLPPYIQQPVRSESEYQTVYARRGGAADGATLDSAAAPTAGLHFTPAVFEALRKRGIHCAFLTLGVGVGTFRPIQVDALEAHTMHEEEFEVPAATAKSIAAQRSRGGRVVAVGTTTTRVLESLAADDGTIAPGFGRTSIFIRPGYRFRCVDALLTNFHLPRSSLLAMVAAFAESKGATDGLTTMKAAYAEAVGQRYRFFSFGDAMLIE